MTTFDDLLSRLHDVQGASDPSHPLASAEERLQKIFEIACEAMRQSGYQRYQEGSENPRPTPEGFRWNKGDHAYYHNPGCDYHGHEVILEYADPCGDPGWSVSIVAPKPGQCVGMAVDEKQLWTCGQAANSDS